MLCLLFLSLILAVLAQGENICPLNKYYTVNTYRTEKSFFVSCYGLGADCEVYYVPPGSGCKGGTQTFLLTVPENQSYSYTSEIDLELGGGFCSNNQIGVYNIKANRASIGVHLPSPPDAGTLFNLPLVYFKVSGYMTCVVSALSSAATVTVDRNGDVESFSIDPFMFSSFNFSYPGKGLTYAILRINSNNPVVVSCVDSRSGRLSTLQEISSKPLLVNLEEKSDNYVIVLYSDCKTNDVISDTSGAKFNFAADDNQNGCFPAYWIRGATGMKAYRFSQSCIGLIEPPSHACLSVGLVKPETFFVTMAVPESKLSTRFIVQDTGMISVNLLSFSETKCTGYVDKSDKMAINLRWGASKLDGKISMATWSETFAQVSWMECQNPVLMVSREEVHRYPFLSTYEAEKAWYPFFKSEGCIVPSSFDDSRSLVTSLVAFFGFVILSSSLL